MAIVSGLSFREISLVADWYLTEEALKAKLNRPSLILTSRLPMTRIYGRGNKLLCRRGALLCAREYPGRR
jgi:hypothetical protein